MALLARDILYLDIVIEGHHGRVALGQPPQEIPDLEKRKIKGGK